MEAEFLENIIKKYEHDNSIYKVLSLKTEPAVKVGENYLSQVTRIKAVVRLKSGVKRTISVVMKEELGNSAAANYTRDNRMFPLEAHVYTNILHKMDELMLEYGDRRDKLWADIIYFLPNKIIFQDLKELDYKMTQRIKGLDLAHSKLIIRSLGRFHAMSKILLNNKIISPNDVQPYCILNDENFVQKLWGNGLKVLSREMKDWGPEWTDIRERLIKCSDTIAKRLIALYKYDEDNFNVINHGDCWTSNMLFKYDPYESIPISMRFVDYQLAHYNSFSWDITYFLHTSLFGEFRRKHYNELINDYYQSLRDTLLLYNYPENSIPTLNRIHKEMENIKEYAFILTTLTHPVMTMIEEKSFSLDESMQPEMFENYGFNLEIFKGRYKVDIGPDIRRFAELGVI